MWTSDNCSTSIYKLHRTCPNPNCSFELCIVCCQDVLIALVRYDKCLKDSHFTRFIFNYFCWKLMYFIGWLYCLVKSSHKQFFPFACHGSLNFCLSQDLVWVLYVISLCYGLWYTEKNMMLHVVSIGSKRTFGLHIYCSDHRPCTLLSFLTGTTALQNTIPIRLLEFGSFHKLSFLYIKSLSY